ncbi:MAG: hypothetical protein AAFZ87_02385 [Planctomycetota bacterium]
MPAAVLAGAVASGCASTTDGPGTGRAGEAPPPPVPGAVLANELIEPGEVRFANLWQVTFGGENAEAYWSYDDRRLSLQVTKRGDWDCDRIFVTRADGTLRQISNGEGVTTCSFFLPGDREVLYASTQSGHAACPKRPRPASGEYVWPIWPDYDVYVTDLETGDERPLITGPGYDAEATISPLGDRIVYTSTASGDLELWTCDLDGSNRFQVTDALGYDGGAFFSHAGDELVFRATAFPEDGREAAEERYKGYLQQWQVRPSRMEIYTIDADGSNRRQVTDLGGANFAPYFTPDDGRILFSSNHHSVTDGGAALNFDLFLCDRDGSNLEQVTFFDGGVPGKQFDAFPMFSRDGRFLVFSSNRCSGKPGDTNVFVAEWLEPPTEEPDAAAPASEE